MTDKVNANLDAIADEFAAKDQSIAALGIEVEAVQGDVSGLGTAVATLGGEVDAVQSALTPIQEEIDDLPASIASAIQSSEFSATQIKSGTMNGDRLPGMSADKPGGVPATGSDTGKVLKQAGWTFPDMIDLVGGRLARASDSQLKYEFSFNNMITLWDAAQARWRFVRAATEPTFANNGTELLGGSLSQDTVYDVFAEMLTDSSFALRFLSWRASGAGASSRCAAWQTGQNYPAFYRASDGANYYICIQAHLSGAANRPGSGASWQDYWYSYGSNAKCLAVQDGVEVLGGLAGGSYAWDGRKYRFLGLVRLDGGSIFADNMSRRFIVNKYNQRRKLVEIVCFPASWTYNSTTMRESAGGGANVLRGEFLALEPVNLYGCYSQCVTPGGSGNAVMGGLAINTTTTFAYKRYYCISPTDTFQATLNNSVTVLTSGYNWVTGVEQCTVDGVSATFVGGDFFAGNVIIEA
jgi:hypothetical protein